MNEQARAVPDQARAVPDQERGTVAGLLLREMETRNWSQREMAKACQLSNTTISKIVRGQSIPDPNTCFKLAQGLALPVPYVLRMAGHEIADVQAESPSVEAMLHAQFDHLPERAIQEMIGAIRAIENAYTTPSSEDLLLAQEKIENLELIRRWLDPIKRQALTVVQGGNFLFYQTADLDAQGQEHNRSELLPIQEDVSRLSTFPALNFANSFCVQLYPLCEFEAHRCRSHPMHAVMFTPIYAGDRGTGVLVVYPDGRQVAVQDQVTAQIWSRIYADLAHDRGTLPLIPSTQQKRQLSKVRKRWLEGDPDELWINPDARTYAAFFASRDQNSTYHLLTGPVSEISAHDWREASVERIEIVDAALHGRFETSIVHLQGFCLRLYPALEHITATRHIVPAHRVLIWEQENSSHACVMQNYLEAWLHLRVDQDEQGRVSIAILEDTPLREDAGRQRIEALAQTLSAEGMPVIDSRSPN
jgi:transcriptional regulator with XRE-family HTH domain